MISFREIAQSNFYKVLLFRQLVEREPALDFHSVNKRCQTSVFHPCLSVSLPFSFCGSPDNALEGYQTLFARKTLVLRRSKQTLLHNIYKLVFYLQMP